MPTTNYDVSELIRYRNARVLYNFKLQLANDGISNQFIPEQGPPSLNAIYAQRVTGGMPRIIDGVTKIGGPPVIVNEGILLRSKNNISDGGFTVGAVIDKTPPSDEGDGMGIEPYDYELTPFNFQSSFFPGMADFIDENIVAGDKLEEDRLKACYWNDWGGDIFDNWGFFYLYDVESGKYYFPLLNPINDVDGVITTQTFIAFGRTFTIAHGYPVQGIFKFDISVNDNKPFKFGAYGNMGSDEDTMGYDLTHSYSLGGNNLTLHYQFNTDGSSSENFYSYWIPKNISENASQTYNVNYDGENISMMSKEVTSGVIVYFAKTNDVKEWVVNDLELNA